MALDGDVANIALDGGVANVALTGGMAKGTRWRCD